MSLNRQPRPLPTLADVRAWLAASDERPKPSAAARAFGIKGADERRAFKIIFKQALAGETSSGDAAGGMPPVTLFRVTLIDKEGAIIAQPERWTEPTPIPSARVESGRAAGRLAIGARLIARTESDGEGGWIARPIRVLPEGAASGPELAIVEIDGRDRITLRAAKPGRERTWTLAGKPPAGLVDGQLVLASPEAARPGPRGRDYRARILSTHGQASDPAAFGLAMLASLEAPLVFSNAALAEAEDSHVPSLGKRDDLRATPLATIDGADARDFDDAVYAEPAGPGWRVVVAIADVSFYVRPGGALDREARERGNSTYLPDRAIPMLPEALSTGLCSLKPDEDRACLYVEMIFDAEGKRIRSRFGRGLMRSSRRWTYEAVEAAAESRFPEPEHAALQALYGAFACLMTGRARRAPLELDLPERKVLFDDAGKPIGLALRPALSNHKPIEEFMVQANAAAAETLLAKHAGALFRVHDKPDPERIGLLAETAQSLGAAGAGVRLDSTRRLNALLEPIADAATRTILSELILRSQAQARYAEECEPHFGLALEAYAHFTSPIRRYADLIVHRALISCLDLGPDGDVKSVDTLEAIADGVNRTERRSASVERATVDRYGALFAAEHVGEELEGRIVGANRVGLFIRFVDPLLEGFAPAALLPDDYWSLSRDGLAMEGRRSGAVMRMGDAVTARIRDADPATGGVTLQITTSLRRRSHGKGFTKKRRR